MRGNGLRAEAYRLIADVEPEAAEELLAALKEHGIAAYAANDGNDGNTSDEGRAGAGRTVRFYADADHAEQAAELLQHRAGKVSPSEASAGNESSSGLAQLDEEAAWSRIVAAYDQEPTDPVPRWPVVEDTDPEETESRDGHEDTEDGAEDERGNSLPVATRWATRGAAADDEAGDEAGDELPPMRTTEETERFVPPTPPPLPRLDPVSKVAWIAVLGAPGLFVVAVALGVTLPTWLTGLAVAAFIGGMIALFMRLKSGPPDDTDNGAVV